MNNNGENSVKQQPVATPEKRPTMSVDLVACAERAITIEVLIDTLENILFGETCARDRSSTDMPASFAGLVDLVSSSTFASVNRLSQIIDKLR